MQANRHHYEILLITPAMFPRAAAAAEQGFKDAQLAITLVERTLAAMQRASMECMCLDCRALLDPIINRPTAFALCIPLFPKDRDEAFVCPVCDVCVERSDLPERMLESLRDICPSATVVGPHRVMQ